MSVKSRVSNKVSGLAKHADMLGATVGYLGTFAAVTKSEGIGFFEGLIARHVNAVKIHNVGKLSDIPSRLTQAPPNSWGGMVIGGLGIGVAGLLGSYLPSIVPWQGSLCSIAKKAGFGAALGGLIACAVGELSEGSGGSVIEGSSSSGSSGSISTTGMVPRPSGAFAPPSPYVGTWSRPR